MNMTRSTKRFLALALGIPTTFALITGCAPEEPPAAPAETAISMPALNSEQVAAVAAAAGKTLSAGDEEKDASKLSSRVTGTALKLRKAEYQISKSTKDEKTITELPSTMQSVFLTSNDSWPRTMFAVSERPQNLEPERLMVYTQAEARSDYKLWSYLTLFPGITVPMFPAAEVGTTEVTDVDESLQMTPTKALEEYAALLKSASKDNKAKFDLEKDTFYTSIADRRSTLKEAAEQIEGTYKETFKVGKNWKALRTLDGGALVVGTIETSGTLKGESGAVVTPSALEKAFLPKGTDPKNALTVKRTATVAIYIPIKDDKDTKPRNIGRLIRTTDASIPQ